MQLSLLIYHVGKKKTEQNLLWMGIVIVDPDSHPMCNIVTYYTLVLLSSIIYMYFKVLNTFFQLYYDYLYMKGPILNSYWSC